MGISSKAVSQVGAFLSVVMLLALGPAHLQSSVPNQDEAKSFVLSVTDTVQAAQLVESLGGSIEGSSFVLNAVTAELTVEQADMISRSSLVSRISEAGSAKDLNEDLQVAGFWWGQ